MTIGDLLNELRIAVPECRLAAYIDLNAELVLTVSTAEKPPQETLDGLAETAAWIMPMGASPIEQCLFDRPGPEEAIFLNVDDTLIFARSMAEPADVICCECARSVDVDRALASARMALNLIGSPQ